MAKEIDIKRMSDEDRMNLEPGGIANMRQKKTRNLQRNAKKTQKN